MEEIFDEFLWDGNTVKIDQRILTNLKESGGLKLVDLAAKDEYLKIQWIKRMQGDSKVETLAYKNLLPATSDMI